MRNPKSFTEAIGFRINRKNLIRVLKMIVNKKQNRFYEPPAIRHEEADIQPGFKGHAKWEKEGKPMKVWYEYSQDILLWVNRVIKKK